VFLHEFGTCPSFGHDQEAVAFANDVLDLWQLMAAEHDEAVLHPFVPSLLAG
jgi:hypothetical protein